MPTSVKTNLRRAIKSCLQEITVANGYNNTILHVYDPPRNMEQMIEYPCVNILFGRAERDDIRKSYAGNNSLLDIHQIVQLDVFLNEINDPPLEQDKITADIQKYFGKNYYIQPSAGERTAFECLYLSDLPWGTEREVPSCGVTIELEIWYSQRREDPYTMIY